MSRYSCVVLSLIFLVWTGFRVHEKVVYNIYCEEHLERAARANTVETARDELGIALQYLEENCLTEGYTSVLWETPSEDLGFWYKNLKSAYNELEGMTGETPPLERTNTLIKLRGILLDRNKDGDTVVAPAGISVFPNNTLYFYTGWLTFIMTCTGVFLLIRKSPLFL